MALNGSDCGLVPEDHALPAVCVIDLTDVGEHAD